MNNAMTREEWLAERKKGVGGSDVAAILGISPWSTAVDVWLDKTGRAAEKPETEAMRIGTELEDFVARRYCEATGRTVQRYNRMVRKGCLLGNFDRLVVPEGEKIASHMGEIRTDTLLECKTSSRDWEDGVPIYYQTQVQHYMGLEPRLVHADVAVLFLNHKHFETIRVERDDAIIHAMQERVEAWWAEYVAGDKMPPPESEEDAKKLWARSRGVTIEATPDAAEAARKYLEAKATADAAKEMMQEWRDKICAAMGEADTLVGPDGKTVIATWKSAKDSSKTDWEAVARALGATEELIAAHTASVPGARRFAVKAPKEAKSL